MNLLFKCCILVLFCVASNCQQNLITGQGVKSYTTHPLQPPQQAPLITRQLVSQGSGFQDCACAANFKCPTCGPNGYEQQIQNCQCMQQPACPNCFMGKILKLYHEKGALNAKKDAQTQNKLALESMLEKKLFETAAKYAQDAAAEEKLAKEAVVLLQEHASKAALARGKMMRAEGQAKQVAAKALQTLTTTSSQVIGKNFPSIQVTQTGVHHVAITQNTPEYQINVGVGAGDGYLDAVNQEITDSVKEDPTDQHRSAYVQQEQIAVPQKLQDSLDSFSS